MFVNKYNNKALRVLVRQHGGRKGPLLITSGLHTGTETPHKGFSINRKDTGVEFSSETISGHECFLQILPAVESL